MLLMVLLVLRSDSCSGVALHTAVGLLAGLSRLLLLLVVIVVWVVYVSAIKRARRRMVLAPSRFRLGRCLGPVVLVGGVPSCLLNVVNEVDLEFLLEVVVRVCLRFVRLVCVRLAIPFGGLALLQMVGAGEGVEWLSDL